MSDRGYQTDFSKNNAYIFDKTNRQRKAKTLIKALEVNGCELASARVLNVGGGAGGLDFYIAQYVSSVCSMDIDEAAVSYANANHKVDNLHFFVADGMHLPLSAEQFDVVICSHVYEHVPDAEVLMLEIARVMKADGVCYFAAGNRMQVMEPHYKLPFLSVIPRQLAHVYMRVSGKGQVYYEKHLSYWGLKKLVRGFARQDITGDIIKQPSLFHAEYMLPYKSAKRLFADLLFTCLKPLFPSYIWLLRKKHP
jgi:ubiquinone/menaquinone biosynthesis C-methylase UbiE